MFKIKKAITLVELVVSITISAIIIVFLMSFIANIFGEISYSQNKTKIINELYEIEELVKTKNNQYLSGTILINNESGIGSDVFLIKTLENENIKEGFIFAMIDKDTFKIDSSNNIDNIGDKVFAYRKISGNQFLEIETDPNNVYNYEFNRDKIFENIKLKDFQVELYNSGKIYDFIFEINVDFLEKTKGQKYSDIGTEGIENIILNF